MKRLGAAIAWLWADGDAALVIGAAVVTMGLWELSPILGKITAGVFVMVVGWMFALRAVQRNGKAH